MNTIDEALKDLKIGKSIIVMDDEDRENEGDLIASAELCTPETVNFMSKYGKGLICVSVTQERAKELELDLMVSSNTALHNTKFTVSVDYAHNTSTGISASDRAETIKAISDKNTKPSDLLRPGHIFPLISNEDGVLKRAGHTEATVDLMELAGLKPTGVMCEIIKDDGTMARRDDLMEFAKEHDLKVITVKELIKYRLTNEKIVRVNAEAKLPIQAGTFNIKVYSNLMDNHEHFAVIKGDIKGKDDVLVRVHSECMTGDIFGSLRCDCGEQLNKALELIEDEGAGILVYMRQEGRGIGLTNKIKAYGLQDNGMDTVEANHQLGFPADNRDYGLAAQILKDLSVKSVKLLTNNPQKKEGLENYGLKVNGLVPLEIEPNDKNRNYLKTKKSKLGHLLKNI